MKKVVGLVLYVLFTQLIAFLLTTAITTFAVRCTKSWDEGNRKEFLMNIGILAVLVGFAIQVGIKRKLDYTVVNNPDWFPEYTRGWAQKAIDKFVSRQADEAEWISAYAEWDRMEAEAIEAVQEKWMKKYPNY